MGKDKQRDRTSQRAKKRLYLLRHAKAELGDPSEDKSRRLAERGHEQMAALAAALEGRKFSPQLALVSPSARTLETLQLLGSRLGGAEIEMRRDFYHASAGELLAGLRELDDKYASVLVIGHNPGLHELAIGLLEPNSAVDKPKLTRRLLVGFPTASLAELVFRGRWADLDAAQAELCGFLRPKDLLSQESP